MPETKFIARDVIFSREGSDLGDVRSIFPIGSSADLIDASVYGDEWKDYRPGQRDGEEGDVVIMYDPTNADVINLEADYEDGEVHSYGVSDTASGLDKTIPAICRKLVYGLERDGLQELRVTLKIVSPGLSDTGS